MLRYVLMLSLALMGLIPGAVNAQSRSLFGSNGPTGGQTGLGSSSSLGGNSATGLDTSALGNTQTIGTDGLDIAGSSIQLSGQSGFVGRSDTAGRFVGNTQATQGNTTQQRGVTGRGQTGNRQFATGQNGQFGNFNSFNQTGQNGTVRRGILRPQQRGAFDYPQRAAPAIAETVNVRFQRVLSAPQLKTVTVVPGPSGTIVLRGEVATEDARRLAAAIARLEPGVRAVQNELTVSGK